MNKFLSNISLNSVIIGALIVIYGLFPPQIIGRIIFTFERYDVYGADVIFFVLASLLIITNLVRLNKLILLWMAISILFISIAFINNATVDHGEIGVALRLSMLLFIPLIKIEKSESEILLKTLLAVIFINLAFSLCVWVFGGVFVSKLSTHFSNGDPIVPFAFIGGQIQLSYLAALAIAILFKFKTISKNKIYIVVMLFFLVIILDSRTGLLIGLITLVGGVINGKIDFKKIMGIFALGGILTGVFLYLATLGTHRIVHLEFQDNSSMLRLNALKYSLEVAHRRPIIGDGVGYTFPYIDKELVYDEKTKNDNYVFIRDGMQVPTEPHDTYLLVLVDYGIIGLILLISYFFFLFYRAKDGDRSFYYYLTAMFSVGCLTSSFIINDLRMAIVFMISINLFFNLESQGKEK